LALFIDEIEKGQYAKGSKMTFSELVEKWRKNHAEINLEHKTLYRYNEMLESRILPAIGHILLLTKWMSYFQMIPKSNYR
jgi:integrase